MRIRRIIFLILILNGLSSNTIVAKENIKTNSPQITQEELDLKEFQEFKKRRQKERDERNSQDGLFSYGNSDEKKLFIYFQGGSGRSITNYETGHMQFGKAGFGYKIDQTFDIGFSIGNSSLDLHSINSAQSQAIAYLSLSAYNRIQSQTRTEDAILRNQFLFAKLLDSPNAFFYLSNVFKYRYNTGQIDLTYHLNRDNFLDPYIGLGIIGGSCTGPYPCQIRGGEIKVGVQINNDSTFTFIQTQGQTISIKEPGFEAFRTTSIILSLGSGLKF